MKRSLGRRLFLILAVCATCFAWMRHGTAAAGAVIATTTLQVGASVQVRCNIVTQPLNFGTYSVTNPTAHDVTGNISLHCTESIIDIIMHIRMGQGLNPAPGSTAANPMRRMTNGSGNYLRYGIYRNAARTQVWGDTILTAVFPGFGPYPANIPVYGRIPALQSVPPGTYTDTVVVDLWF